MFLLKEYDDFHVWYLCFITLAWIFLIVVNQQSSQTLLNVWHLFLQAEDYGTEPQEVQLEQQEMTEEEVKEPEEEIEAVSQVTEAEEVRDDCEVYEASRVHSF